MIQLSDRGLAVAGEDIKRDHLEHLELSFLKDSGPSGKWRHNQLAMSATAISSLKAR